MQPSNAAPRSPSTIARAVKGWRCSWGFHRWRLRTIAGREFCVTEYQAWEVYEECERCGQERSHIERNRKVAAAIAEEVERPWAV